MSVIRCLCGNEINGTPWDPAGDEVRCPNCGAVIRVPPVRVVEEPAT